MDHAKVHQSRLASSARNRRLESEAQIQAQDEAAAARLAAVGDVEIKIRYPDQSQIVSKFTSVATAASLHAFVRSTLEHEHEAFLLKYTSTQGPKVVADDAGVRLIRDLGLTGRVLVNMMWHEGASAEARASATTLKKEFAAAAREIKVEAISTETEAANAGRSAEAGDGKSTTLSNTDGPRRKGGVPKWLKLPGKK